MTWHELGRMQGLFVGRTMLVITQNHSWMRASVSPNKNVAVTFGIFADVGQMVFWVPNRTQEHMVDA